MNDPLATRRRALHLLVDLLGKDKSLQLLDNALDDLAAILVPEQKYRKILIAAAIQQAEEEQERVYVIGGQPCSQ